MKYQLVRDDNIIIDGQKFFRIRAMTDIINSNRTIKKGTLGGYVRSENNLSQNGNCWIADDAIVGDNSRVSGDAFISGNAVIKGHCSVIDNAVVKDKSIVSDKVTIMKNAIVSDSAIVSQRAIISGNGKVGGKAIVCGDATICQKANIVGESYIGGNATVCGQAEINGARIIDFAHISSNALLEGPALISDYAVISGNAKIYEDSVISGKAYVSGKSIIINTTIEDSSLIRNSRLYNVKICGQSEINNCNVGIDSKKLILPRKEFCFKNVMADNSTDISILPIAIYQDIDLNTENICSFAGDTMSKQYVLAYKTKNNMVDILINSVDYDSYLTDSLKKDNATSRSRQSIFIGDLCDTLSIDDIVSNINKDVVNFINTLYHREISIGSYQSCYLYAAVSSIIISLINYINQDIKNDRCEMLIENIMNFSLIDLKTKKVLNSNSLRLLNRKIMKNFISELLKTLNLAFSETFITDLFLMKKSKDVACVFVP